MAACRRRTLDCWRSRVDRSPNLQNIPIRTEAGNILRRMLFPDWDWTLLTADYSEVERLCLEPNKDPGVSYPLPKD